MDSFYYESQMIEINITRVHLKSLVEMQPK